MKTADRVLPKSTSRILPVKAPQKRRNSDGDRLPPFCTSSIGKNHDRLDMVSREPAGKELKPSRLLSISASREKLARDKAMELGRQGLRWHTKETKRLSSIKRLQLFRALSREPMSFLDLHVRFGVSKQTIKRLVKNGFLVEIWGSNDVGIRFRLTRKSKNRLEEFEVAAKAAKYDSRMIEKNAIRPRSKI